MKTQYTTKEFVNICNVIAVKNKVCSRQEHLCWILYIIYYEKYSTQRKKELAICACYSESRPIIQEYLPGITDDEITYHLEQAFAKELFK